MKMYIIFSSALVLSYSIFICSLSIWTMLIRIRVLFNSRQAKLEKFLTLNKLRGKKLPLRTFQIWSILSLVTYGLFALYLLYVITQTGIQLSLILLFNHFNEMVGELVSFLYFTSLFSGAITIPLLLCHLWLKIASILLNDKIIIDPIKGWYSSNDMTRRYS